MILEVIKKVEELKKDEDAKVIAVKPINLHKDDIDRIFAVLVVRNSGQQYAVWTYNAEYNSTAGGVYTSDKAHALEAFNSK